MCYSIAMAALLRAILRGPLRVFPLMALALILIGLPAGLQSGRGEAESAGGPVLGGPSFVLVRDLPPTRADPQAGPASHIHGLPDRGVRDSEGSGPVRSPPINATDTSFGTREDLLPMAPPSVSTLAFEGLSDDNNAALAGFTTTPPDPQVAAGNDHILEMVNSVGRISDKNGGVVQTFTLASFFQVPGGWIDFDPKVIYDALDGRWFASYVSIDDNPGVQTDLGRLHLAISQTADPTGVWNVYYLEYTDNFPDYPGIGVTDDKFTASSNLFDIDGSQIDPSCSQISGLCGDQTIVIQKSDVMAGAPTPGIHVFPVNANRFTVRPAHSLSATSDQWLAAYHPISTTTLTVIKVTGTPNAANVTEALATNLTVAVQNSPPPSLTAGAGDCIVRGQNLGPPPCIDSGDWRLLEAIWRDGKLWTSASAVCDTSLSCAHLTEVDTGSVSVTQDIMFGAAGEFYSWPAIRTDASGDLYVSLTHTNTSIFAEARTTGRQAGDPPGTMSGTALLRAGDVVHTSGRWGDYLGAAVDPRAPDCVWLVGEYARNTTSPGTFDWGTYIAATSYDGACSADPDGDTLPDPMDNCPADSNPAQTDTDGDSLGDACDSDADGDDVLNVAEVNCGSDPLNGSQRPERIDGVFAGVDDDGDTLTDEALDPGAASYDCDGDGFVGSIEDNVYSPSTLGDQDPCGSNSTPPTDPPSPIGWPADVWSNGIPDSINRVTIQDLTSFLAPIRYLDTDLGTNPGDHRWDLVPGAGLFLRDINLQDLTTLISLAPPMLGFTRAFNGPACAWPP